MLKFRLKKKTVEESLKAAHSFAAIHGSPYPYNRANILTPEMERELAKEKAEAIGARTRNSR